MIIILFIYNFFSDIILIEIYYKMKDIEKSAARRKAKIAE